MDPCETTRDFKVVAVKTGISYISGPEADLEMKFQRLTMFSKSPSSKITRPTPEFKMPASKLEAFVSQDCHPIGKLADRHYTDTEIKLRCASNADI